MLVVLELPGYTLFPGATLQATPCAPVFEKVPRGQ